MDALITALGVLCGLALLGLSVVGGVTIVAEWGGRGSERQRMLARARVAERQIVEIGRQAQAAILREALRHAQRRRPSDVGPDKRHG